MRIAFFLATLPLLAVQLLAAEPATITVSKGDTFAITVAAVEGPEGALVKRTLENDLTLSGYFNLVPAGKAGFTAAGSASGGALQGKVTDAGGQTVLSRTYNGSPRANAHQFARDIVETITGKPGIAGSRIAFSATRTGRKEIYVADYDGGNVEQLTSDNSISVAPSLSPDGRRLAYTGYKSGYADIYTIDLTSRARNRIIKFPGTNSGPAFSPDGSQLAMTLSKDGNPEIYVTSAGGGGARRLTRSRGVESSPTWSPDGSEIIYTSDDRGTPQLYRMSASGGGSRMLPTGYSYCTDANWSPDGRKVAFSVRQGGSFQIAILDLNGGGTRIVADGEDPVWGADSRHLIFVQGGSLQLLNTQNGRKSTVVSGLGKISEPTWSR